MSFTVKYKNFSKTDNYNTPKTAWIDILQFFNKDTKLWLPFYNDGTAEYILKSMEYTEIYHKDKDFFEYEKPGYIVCDNPPWSIKAKIIEKLYGTKFCLLFPLDTLERQYLTKYKDDLQVVIPKKRYSFIEGKESIGWKSAWFCWKLQDELGTTDQLIFL